MSNYSEKLGTFREKLIDMLRIHYYPDYKIGSYLNGSGRVSWLSVTDYTGLRIAEVIAVESFGPGDKAGGGTDLLVIDYVNSNSSTFKNIDLALDNVKCILTTASERKKACETQAADEKQAEDTDHKTLFMQNLLKNVFGFNIKDVIFNDPATIVFWEDGEKTVVQCQNGEEFDPEKGLAMAISKKVYGNDYNYYEIFKKWIGKYKKKKSKTKNPREGQDFNDYLNEQLKDPEFKKQYENTEIINEEDDNK